MEVFAASSGDLFDLGLTMCQQQIRSEAPEKLFPGEHTQPTRMSRILVSHWDVDLHSCFSS